MSKLGSLFSLWMILLALLCSGLAATAQTAVSTVAGTGVGGFSGDSGLAINAKLNVPTAVALDSSGNLFIADADNFRIRKVDAVTGVITTIAGSGLLGSSDITADSGNSAADSKLGRVVALAVDASGNLFFTDTQHHVVRKIEASTGNILAFAGTGVGGYSGDGGLGTLATLRFPRGLGLDSSGNVYIADTGNNVVRKVTVSSGAISTVAGNGEIAPPLGDGSAATSARLNGPTDVAVAAGGDLFIADSGNQRIRRVDFATQTIFTYAGTGTAGFSGDGAIATSATFDFPHKIGLDGSGNLLIADAQNNRIRKVAPGPGVVTTVMGGGTSGDGDAPASISLIVPNDLAVTSAGNIYVAESAAHSIRLADSSSTSNVRDSDGDGFTDVIETEAGTSTANPAATPFGGVAPLAEVPVIDRLSIKLKFNTSGQDAITIKGSLRIPEGTSLASQSLLFDIGGVSVRFTSDASGRFSGGANETIKVKLNRNGVLVGFLASFKLGDFQAALADEGLTAVVSEKTDLAVRVEILFNNTIHSENVVVRFAKGSGKGSGLDFTPE